MFDAYWTHRPERLPEKISLVHRKFTIYTAQWCCLAASNWWKSFLSNLVISLKIPSGGFSVMCKHFSLQQSKESLISNMPSILFSMRYSRLWVRWWPSDQHFVWLSHLRVYLFWCSKRFHLLLVFTFIVNRNVVHKNDLAGADFNTYTC